jgi:hypothetical protein
MLFLSILLPIAYIPGVTGAAISTGWAVMSTGLPIVTWRGAKEPLSKSSFGFLVLWISFFLYAVLSLLWTDNPITGVSELWQVALMGFAFYAGSQLTDLRTVTIGLAIGFGISSLLTIAQALGLTWITEFVPCRPSGLTFNPIILGEGCALTILLCLQYRLFALSALLAPGLLLSQSRGAFLALAIGLVLTYCRPRQGLFTFAPIWVTCSFSDAVTHGDADNFRWMIWRVLWHFLDLWGHGAGSLDAVLIRFHDHLYQPSYAHNEFLDLAYQFGIGAIPAFALLLAPLTQSSRREWPTYAAFTICLLFSFPLHSPPLAFLGLVVAGNLSRDWGWARNLGHLSRSRAALQASGSGAGVVPLAV